MRVPVTSQPHQHLLLPVLWILAILTGIYWYLTVVFICSSMMTYDVEHLFICLFDICVSSLVRCLFRSVVHFLIGLFSFCFFGGLCFLIVEFLVRCFFFNDRFWRSQISTFFQGINYKPPLCPPKMSHRTWLGISFSFRTFMEAFWAVKLHGPPFADLLQGPVAN